MQLNTDYNYDSLTVSILNKNITSLNYTSKTQNYSDELVRVTHYYVNDNLNLPSIEEYRDKEIEYNKDFKVPITSIYLNELQKKKQYMGEEDLIKCGRFPKQRSCGCNMPCSLIIPKIDPIEVLKDKLYTGPIESAYKTKQLLSLQITHILNLSCTEYQKRNKFFKYMNIFINDNHTENAIKFFKITNRFISDALNEGKKVLIHSVNGKGRCWVFIIAYLIGREKKKFHEAIEYVRELFPRIELNDNFYTQLKHYDLETNN